MITFDVENRFDQKTGKPKGTARVEKGYCCDYCGAEIPLDLSDFNEGEGIPVTYELHQELQMEETFAAQGGR